MAEDTPTGGSERAQLMTPNDEANQQVSTNPHGEMEQISDLIRIPCRRLLPGITMDHSHDVQELRRRAHAALHAEILPRVQPNRSWGGRGSGKLCPVCGSLVDPAEMELELEFAATDVGNDTREFHLHLACFSAWEFARRVAATDHA
jgi:hypothetical protein